jgi:hypothetical protein
VALSPGGKATEYEPDHSPPSTTEVKNGGALPPLPHTSSWLNDSFIKHRDSFIFIIIIVAFIKKD